MNYSLEAICPKNQSCWKLEKITLESLPVRFKNVLNITENDGCLLTAKNFLLLLELGKQFIFIIQKRRIVYASPNFGVVWPTANGGSLLHVSTCVELHVIGNQVLPKAPPRLS